MDHPPAVRVRGVGPSDIEAWCSCPLRPGERGHDAWVAAERAWLAGWHAGTDRLYLAEDPAGEVLGKADVPIVRAGRWILWAPTVRPGPTAPAAMEALVAHLCAEAARRGVRDVEVILEGGREVAVLGDRVLRAAGFSDPEERVVVQRDLAELPAAVGPPGEEVATASLEVLPAPQRAALAERAGASEAEVEHLRAGGGAGVVLLLGGVPVGLAVASGEPTDRLLAEDYIGLVPEARGRGLGRPLLLAFCHWGREHGATTYVGSTPVTNVAMRKLFVAAGAGEIGRRRVYRLAAPA